MDYRYVTRQRTKVARKCSSELLCAAQKTLKKKYGITAQVILTGSGKGSFVIRDKTGRFDLDYNLLLQKIPDHFESNPNKLKDVIRTSIDSHKNIGSRHGFSISFGENSTVPITYHLQSKHESIGIDIALVRINECTNRISRLVRAENDIYLWNEVPDNVDLRCEVKQIAKAGHINDLRERYLKKRALNAGEKASFMLFAEAVNEILQII